MDQVLNRRIVKRVLLVAVLGVSSSVAGTARAAGMLLVDKGAGSVPIIVASNAPPATLKAAEELVAYVEKISGASPQIFNEPPDGEGAVWVGFHLKVADLFPRVDFDFLHPEEILMVCDGTNVLIAGRDRMAGTNQTEFGTANAVYTFLQKHLDVRWFWPGPLGEDVPRRETITLPVFSDRFHPPWRMRFFWRGSVGWQADPLVADWFRFQRMELGSARFSAGHSFTDWWEKYHEAHPEWFALRGDGTRTPEKWGTNTNPHAVKMCVSNPEVVEQWLRNAEERLRNDPSLAVLGATPNDGGGFCTCTNCRAWDNTNGPPVWGYVALTDRYVKFWNILARGLRERLPGREAFVGAYAYSGYKTPPVAEKLGPNIAVGYVGHFPLAGDEVTAREKDAWKSWADKATLMFFRPNLFHYTGGPLGLPSVAPRRTFRDFLFLAENKCVGLQVDGLPLCWATQGVQYYVMAQFAYDPFQDGEALLKDYYRRGFGPAADPVEAYFNLLEKAHEALLPQIRHSSGWAREAVAVYQRVYADDLLDAAERLLDQAAAATAQGPARHRNRVAFVRSGFDFVRLQVRIMHAMQRLREGKNKDAAAVKEAVDLCARREQLYKDLWPTFAIRSARWYYKSRRMGDYMGPPSKELLNSARRSEVLLAPSRWKLAWTDDFDRAELGKNWRALEGVWRVEDGCLVSKGGGRLVAARKFPGLHKVEFAASVTPNPGEIVSDMDPIIHCDDKGAGYLMQFGGYYNKRSSIQKVGAVLAKGEHKIEPGKTHSIVAELDGNTLRLAVDGKTILEHRETYPLLGKDRDRIGFYTYQGIVKIERVKVYTSEAVPQTEHEGARE